MACTIDLDELLPEVLVHAPNAPEPLAIRCLREAAKRFCERTLMWREEEELDVTAEPEEWLCGGPDADIISIDHAELDGEPLEPVTVDWLDEHVGRWRATGEDAPARYVTQISPNAIRIVGPRAGKLLLRMTLKPSRTATRIPAIIEQHATLIGQGATARLLLMPSEAQNPDLAVVLGQAFEAGLSSLWLAAQKGQQRARVRVPGRYF